jgi:putative hydrolase of the HAD superfamily
MIKAVLFDFFGVLVEGGREGAIRQVFARAYRVDPDTLRFEDIGLDALKGQVTDEAFIEAMNRQHAGGKKVSPADFRAAADGLAPSAPVYGLAAALRGQGIKTAIVSNTLQSPADSLRAKGLYDGFDPVLLSCEVGMAKPEPAIYQLALDRLGCAPQEVLFIDDQQTFLAPAQDMGIHTILAVSPEQIVHDVKEVIRQENGVVL